MIRYALKCSEGHGFESWFQSAQAFEKLSRAGLVCCAVCGSSEVTKALMAPRVRPARGAAEGAALSGQDARSADAGQSPSGQVPGHGAGQSSGPLPAKGGGMLSQPAGEIEQALARLRKEVEANSDYVGKDFAKHARAMHLGDAPERAIYGEARPEEAKALIEDGVPVLPLPFLPNRKSN